MIHVIISGQVQGVGFRQFIKHNARKLRINGWVKNLDKGNVEGMFNGSQENLQKIVNLCEKGPFLAEVENVKIEEIPDIVFDDFKIIT